MNSPRMFCTLIALSFFPVLFCNDTNNLQLSDTTTQTNITKQSPKSTATATDDNMINRKKEKPDNDNNTPKDATEEVNALASQPAQKPEKQDGGLDETTQVVLANFANMLGNFFNILQAPNNPQNVGNNIAGMLNGMVNIAVEAMKGGQLSIDDDQETIKRYVKQLSNNLKKRLSKMVVTKLKKQYIPC